MRKFELGNKPVDYGALTREMLSTNKELAAKLTELERKVSSHDQAITGLINTIRQLMGTPDSTSRPIGFTADIGKKKKS